MKRLFLSLLVISASVCAFAQNTWEEPKQETQAVGIDPKYAAGVIPMTDGKVIFEKNIIAKGKTQKQIYDIAKKYLQDMTQEPNQITTPVGFDEERISKSRLAIDDEKTGELVATFDEWLVFRKAALMLDRTEMRFCIIIKCHDGNADISVSRIFYIYQEGERGEFKLPAEEVITDENALNKSKTKLTRIFGKFRTKTIDRVNYIFKTFEEILK